MLTELKIAIQKSQKKGIHFIITSAIIWGLIAMTQSLPINQMYRNYCLFGASGLMLPISYYISKLLKIEFSDNKNPLGQLGFLFTLNQLLYILIALWVHNIAPERLVMVYAIIFGAHLLPYSWLYDTKTYAVASVFISIWSFLLGWSNSPVFLASTLVVIELIFSATLWFDLKKNKMIL